MASPPLWTIVLQIYQGTDLSYAVPCEMQLEAVEGSPCTMHLNTVALSRPSWHATCISTALS